MRGLVLQLGRFGLVGIGASAVHFSAALALQWMGTRLLVANVIAFLIALQFSYTGHSLWSFGGHGVSGSQAKKRFLTVALAGFLANETLLALLVRFTKWSAPAMLGTVLCTVAALTFLGSRFWAFSGDTPLTERGSQATGDK